MSTGIADGLTRVRRIERRTAAYALLGTALPVRQTVALAMCGALLLTRRGRPARRRARRTEITIVSILPEYHLGCLRLENVRPPDGGRIAELSVSSDDDVASANVHQRRETELVQLQILHDNQRVAVIQPSAVHNAQTWKHRGERTVR